VKQDPGARLARKGRRPHSPTSRSGKSGGTDSSGTTASVEFVSGKGRLRMLVSPKHARRAKIGQASSYELVEPPFRCLDKNVPITAPRITPISTRAIASKPMAQ
jgi:hypothetical protein